MNTGKTRWKKGCKPPNPKGRPKGASEIDILKQAVKTVEKVKKVSLYQFAVERAYQSDVVLVALLKKLVPDQNEVKGEGMLIVTFDKQDEKL